MYKHVLKQLRQAKNYLEKELKSIPDKYDSRSDICNNEYIGKYIENLFDIECKITVVTQYKMIAEAAGEQGTQVLHNSHPELGISSSLKIGLNANLDADAVLFTVSDQPWLTGETICELIRVFLDSKKTAACVSYRDKMGNPCIFSREYYDELLALEGDKGGKKVLMKHLEDTCIYEVKDARELMDIDYCRQTEN